MTTSRRATKASQDNSNDNFKKYNEAYDKKVAAIKARYEDSGESGRAQQRKELAELAEKSLAASAKRKSKEAEDADNVVAQGKNAMRGRSYAQYNKGGMVTKANCGASMKPTQKKAK
jgi:hypothetical protein